ncbi:DUF7475 family protein [Haloarcula amylovorans]|uniref:DUF7475 family protein n=1 Tax=Haloarcula amylovorans TaxID=2562280 RepID=UPI0010764701|nr:hypothetical protein [Halomicroarcula amylolytica]
MSQSTATRETGLVRFPPNSIAYVAALGALVSAAIHFLLAPGIMGFNQTIGILFYLNGAGWIAGLLVFFSRYWRRKLYLVAAAYAVVTLVAFFVMSGRFNTMSILSKLAEAAVAVTAVYLYSVD